MLAAAALGICVSYAVVALWGTVLLLWTTFLLFSLPFVVVPNPFRQERAIVWALGTIGMAILGGRLAAPYSAVVGVAPALALFWAGSVWVTGRRKRQVP
jgi:hypothetical protein